MEILRDGTVRLQKVRNMAALETIIDNIMMVALANDAMVEFGEDTDNFFIYFEHGQVVTPKDTNTKMKIGEKALLKAYQDYERIK